MIIQHPPLTGIPELDPWLQRLPEQFMNMGWIDVRDFGSLENAIDSAITNSKIVFMPSGTYDLSGFDKSITSEVTIIGAGMIETILEGATKLTTTNGISIKNLTLKDWDIALDVDASGGDISGIYLDSVRITGAGVGIVETGTANVISNVQIRNCEFVDLSVATSQKAIYLAPACVDVVISHNIFKNITSTGTHSYGVVIGSATVIDTTKRITISDNEFYNIDGDGISEANAILLNGSHSVIADNVIDTITGGTTNHEAIYTKGHHIKIQGNVIKDGGQGVGYIAVKGEDDSYANEVSDNILSGTDVGTAGIYVTGSCIITDNTVEITDSGGGIYFYGNLAGSSIDQSLICKGNRVKSYGPALLISAVVKGIITDNILISSNDSSISLTEATNDATDNEDVLIANNMLQPKLTATPESCIVEGATVISDSLIIRDNVIFVDATKSAIYLRAGSTNFSHSGNIVNGSKFATFTDTDATPSVLYNGVNKFKTGNTGGAVDVTDLDNGYAGQIVFILGADGGNSTFKHNAALMNLAGGVDFTLGDGDTLTLMYDGTDWDELSRSNN